MMPGMPPPVLWEPPSELFERAVMTRFMHERGCDDYDALWRWSVEDVEGFWAAVWDFFAVGERSGPVLPDASMPGAKWFPEVELNYAEYAYRGKDDGATAIVAAGETRDEIMWTWGDLREQTARIATGLRRLGVQRGDRVVAYLPNIPEAVAALHACAAIGAVWSSCSPDFGARAVSDRFAQ